MGQTSSYVSQIISILTPQISSAVSTALKAEAAASFSSQYNAQTIVSQVLTALRPSIMTLISESLAAQQAEAERLALLEEQRRQAALEEQRRQAALLEEQRRQAALLEEQRASQQQSSSLSSIFGTGNVHQVKFEIPGQVLEEYSIGK